MYALTQSAQEVSNQRENSMSNRTLYYRTRERTDAQDLIQQILVDEMGWTLSERERIEIEIVMQEFVKAFIEQLKEEV